MKVNTGLHVKVVLIMLLLILSLMMVVSAFLLRGVMSFYTGEFYRQMQDAFSKVEFVTDLRSAAASDEATQRMEAILNAYSGELGIDAGSRNYYILSGDTGRLLSASAEGGELEITPNIITALAGSEGYANDRSEDFMDVALPISGDGHDYVICIRDNKQAVTQLTREIFTIILEALIIGLVISVLLSLLLSKTMVVPIQILTRAARRLADGDFSEGIPVAARDEIGVLTQTFNDMAARLHGTLQEIEGERNKLDTVFHHMTDGVAAFSGDGALIQYNPAAERMLNRSLEGAELRFDDVFGEIASLEAVLQAGGGSVTEGTLEIGSRSLDVSLAPLSGETAQGGVLAVIHDVTEQRRSDDMRREFVANVSHELRTPITNVRSYAETLVDAGADMPPETTEHFLGVILNESDRMTKIVQDLLALSKFDAGETDFQVAPFDASVSARSVYEAMRLDVAKRGLDLSLSLPPRQVMVLGDKARMEQVIINITTNAVRYTPEGGSVELSVFRREQEVCIAVRDTGIGIPEEDIPRIFDRFYRVDKARSRAMGGTGLGLSIAFEIVSRHKGHIEIESQVGKGTTVTVCLPAMAEEAGPEL